MPPPVPPVKGQRKVFVRSSQGEKLPGILHETGSKELVIIGHGFGSSKDRIPMVNLAAALESEGISAFRFDSPGYGESEDLLQFESHLKDTDTLRDIVHHFSRTGRTISAIVGHSKGGYAALQYASKYTDIRTIVNISGWFDLKDAAGTFFGKSVIQQIMQNGFADVKDRRGKILFRATREKWIEMSTVDVRTAALSIPKDCRVLTVHGSKDGVCSPADALEYSKLIRNHKLCIIEGADHHYTKHQTELASIVVKFIKAGLATEKIIGESPIQSRM